jgi:hypothetical protein
MTLRRARKAGKTGEISTTDFRKVPRGMALMRMHLVFLL